MTDPLVAFLKARLDEDEQAARAAGDLGWSYDRETFTVRAEQWEVASRRRSTYPDDPAGATEPILDVHGAHIARHDPARVLAEVQAKRQMIRDIEVILSAAVMDLEIGGELAEAMREFLRLLALPYAGHESYQAEWVPDSVQGHSRQTAQPGGESS